MKRRTFVMASGLVLGLGAHADATEKATHDDLARLEAHSGGRLGVCAVDTMTGRRIDYRAAEPFAMCSTFKLLAVGAVLRRVDAGTERLDRPIRYTRRDMLAYSPVTVAHVTAGSLTVGELCAAAIEHSDNTAANLLLGTIGGPGGVTHLARTIDDRATRLDRTEPELNSAIPGDPRDTTQPAAMAHDMAVLLTGNALAAPLRALLRTWLERCDTGTQRLRAGLPAHWRVGDKTGSGDHGTANDVAIAWPPGRAPIVVASYLTQSTRSDDERDAIHASVARIVARRFTIAR